MTDSNTEMSNIQPEGVCVSTSRKGINITTCLISIAAAEGEVVLSSGDTNPLDPGTNTAGKHDEKLCGLDLEVGHLVHEDTHSLDLTCGAK